MDKWLTTYPPDSVVQKAFNFASEMHEGILRKSGEPYLAHPLAVAKIIHSWGLDETSIAAAFLHDTIEDTQITQKDIAKKFGDEIAFLVEGLTKIEKLNYSKKEKDKENIRKLILSFSKDLRVILIKLADRLHNMKTLEFMTPEKQKEISWETIEIYAPLAYRLGMQKVSGDLQDLSFPYLYSEEYKWIKENVIEQFEERALYAEKIKPIIKKALLEEGITPIAVDSRAKHYYSLWKKLMRYDMDLEKIYDLVALRVIVKNIEECYATLGVIHKNWQPLPARFKDYIANPKSNGYKSLHTTVFCIDDKITEIQIKTEEMHKENELGVAAHWIYEQLKETKKHKSKWSGIVSRKELLWVKQLRNWQEKFNNQDDFLQSLKVDFFKDRVFAITPLNDIIDLPVGATPVDFAYQIHREIGDRCVGAKINGKIASLDTEIQSGDMVEILTQRNKKPSEDWLKFVKTSVARKYIKSTVRKRLGAFVKSKDKILEFKIINYDKAGYLKEIVDIFEKMKINIISLNAQVDKRKTLAVINLKCNLVPKHKIERILTKIKTIPETKEVIYKTLK